MLRKTHIPSTSSFLYCPCLSLSAVSQTSQHPRTSQMQATCDSCFPYQSIFSVISLDSSTSEAVELQESPKTDVELCHIPAWTSHSICHFLWQANWIYENDGMCALFVNSQGYVVVVCVTASTFAVKLHFRNLMGGTHIFVYDGCTFPSSEAAQWQAFCDQAICVHSEILWFAVFLTENLISEFALLAILKIAFHKLSDKRYQRGAGISFGIFPIPWF